MYEVGTVTVVYSTSYEPDAVYSEKVEDRYLWSPGPAKRSDSAMKWIDAASRMEQPTANATVITYTIGDRVVYLTNEEPGSEFYSVKANELYVWVPGVREPTNEDRALVSRVIEAQREGGEQALDREVRKLEKGRDAPPDHVPAETHS